MRPALAAIAVLLLAATPAFAQFPPPGIYRCTTADGAPVGTLSLFAAGDYQFSVARDASFAEKAGDPGNGKGQLASASTSVTALLRAAGDGLSLEGLVPHRPATPHQFQLCRCRRQPGELRGAGEVGSPPSPPGPPRRWGRAPPP